MIERGCLERSHLRDLACQAAGSLREIPYPCCGDYRDYLRGFFSILSSPGSLRFHPGNRAVLQRLGSFSKLGFLAVTSHLTRDSRGQQKSLPILTIIPSILTILPFLWVSTHCSCRGGAIFLVPVTPSRKTEAFARIAFPGWFCLRGCSMVRFGFCF